MARVKTDSFVAEFPLVVSAADARELSVRLDAARNIYNACLGESLRRLGLMRESRDWQRARTMPKGAERTGLFRATMARFGFTFGDIQKHAETCRDACWIGRHLGSHDTQTTSLRAFRAVQMYAFGKRGRPRFKGFLRLNSIEGKSNAAVIRLKATPKPAVHWAGLVLPLKLDPRDRDGWQKEALKRRTKYCRIVRRTLRGKVVWRAQLIQEGLPPRKECRPVGDGVVGLDLGPSTIAAVSGDDATLERFCPTVDQPWQELRRINRALDRSRRAANPENYRADGTIRTGPKSWRRSQRYKARQRRRVEIERRLASERKRAHGELCNRILIQGRTIKTEKISYKSFQKNFGRSVKVRAPGMMVSMLRRKAESAGGGVMEFSTRTTRLSQFDHTTGEYTKKPLSQRRHVFGDGITAPVQRDLYSAFLARSVDSSTLDARQVIMAWPAAEPLLRRAASSFLQSASGPGFPLPRAGRMPDVGADRSSKGCGGLVKAGEV